MYAVICPPFFCTHIFLLSLAVAQHRLAAAKSSFIYYSFRLLWIAHAVFVDHPQMKDNPLLQIVCCAQNIAVIIIIII